MIPDHLDMGIWADDGETIWLPKELYPTRNKAKMFAVNECGVFYSDIRVRSQWMCFLPSEPPEIAFVRCTADDPEAFECWEIT